MSCMPIYFRKKKPQREIIDYSPLKWSDYFQMRDNFISPAGSFNYYKKGRSGPILVCIHGCGYSALTWALFAEEVTSRIECRVLAIDLRGHGNTTTIQDDDLSLTQLTQDVLDIILGTCNNQPVVLVGHSLGASIAVTIANLIPSLVGCIAIDMTEVEGIEALPSTRGFLNDCPKSFNSIRDAIYWNCHFQEHSPQNIAAVRISVPGQIKNSSTNNLGSDEVDLERSTYRRLSISNISENDEEMASELERNYTWRIDLTKSVRFWKGWFKGVSKRFLDVKVPKVLIMADIKSLDTDLIVEQMQGKYQMEIVCRCGHAVHEDHPEEVAEIIASFLIRHQFAKDCNIIEHADSAYVKYYWIDQFL